MKEIRKKLKDDGVELEGPEPETGVLAPGHNPKETPEMFVEKILRN